MGLESRRLGAIGVEAFGLDLRREVSEADWRALRELVMQEGLVLFRDQPMEASVQIELGRRGLPRATPRLALRERGSRGVRGESVSGC